MRCDGGLLKRRGIYSSGGKEPRDYNVFGEYIIAANQFSDTINVLKYDQERYEIADTGISAGVVKPTCIAII